MTKNSAPKEPAVAPGFLRLLTEREAARLLCISPKTLTTWRSLGRYGLAFIKVGRRVRYESTALRDFIARRRVVRTAQKSPARRINPKKAT
jgi:helix-turn-helix protein